MLKSDINSAKDQELVTLIIEGDVDKYGDIMNRYEQKLLRYVIYLARDQISAEDVVQDTFIKAYENLRGYNPKYKFSSWIYRIAHNETMNAIKKDKHFDHSVDVDLVDNSTESTIITEIDNKILNNNLKICLNEIDIKYREILMLQYFENMKYSEIADIIHIPPSTVGVWSLRAKAKLKEVCQKKGVRHE